MSNPSGEIQVIKRYEQLVDLLNHGWQSYESLGTLLDRQERTLRRDIERLKAMGFPLESQWDGQHKQFRLQPGFRKHPIEPGILEVIAANLGRGVLGFLDGTELSEEMENLFNQLQESSRASKRQLKDLHRKFWFMPDGPRDYSGSNDQLNELITCLLDQKAAFVSYRTRQNALQEFKIHPFTLIVRRECLYVLCELPESPSNSPDRIRLFDLTRMEVFRRTKETFIWPENFEPAGVFCNSFGVFIPRSGEAPATDVEIWFDTTVGAMIQRRKWHPSQRWVPDPNGGWRLCLFIRVCPELTHWLVGFGPAAKVMRPHSLRDDVIKEHQQALQLYRKRRRS